LQEHRERRKRLAAFEKQMEAMPPVWEPRLKALQQRFGDQIKVTRHEDALASILSACGKTKATTASVAGPDSTAAAKQRAILRGVGPTNSATVTRAGEITPP
jgi:hypothetical protein